MIKLNKADLNQILFYIDSNIPHYYGDQNQFDKREEKIMNWLKQEYERLDEIEHKPKSFKRWFCPNFGRCNCTDGFNCK